MLFSGKKNVFMCLAVTKFILRKINFGVWFIYHFTRKSIKSGKTLIRRAARSMIAIAPLIDRRVRSSITPLVAIDRNRRRDRTANRSTSGAIAISRISRSRRLLLHLGLSGFVFSFFFSKHQKIFFRNFFEMQPNT